MTKKYIIKGLVQGIGYRPFVAKLADELNINGWVRNTGGIVTVLADGDEDSLEVFHKALSSQVPTGGFVTSIECEDVDFSHVKDELSQGFRIVESDEDSTCNLPLIPADICTCEECTKELLDPANRRYMHPFISCTICGPRYSIIEKLPYDRDTISMKIFDMCPDCKKEYTGKLDRRRHAQTIACKACGPQLAFTSISGGDDTLGAPMDAAISLIKAGGIVAVKDIGGYHLVCDPFNADAVAALRTLKHREAKAFAIMFRDADSVKEYCQMNEQEVKLLTSPARPIVLLKRKYDNGKDFADNVCLTSPDIGAMLPCNPVQIMLSEALGPLIMTSGNSSKDVLETDDVKMIKWMQERADSGELEGVSLGVLSHNRPILRPMDDSLMKVVKGRQQFVRRARGFVPNPISVDISGEIFASGGDLKSSFCFIKNGLAYMSQYLGDMESVNCQSFYKREQQAMMDIFGFNPEAVAVDRHPAYFSRSENLAFASKYSLPTKEIQHHKAHVAAVIAEHKLTSPVLGFAFDGTGYGDDGTIWGSEVFSWNGGDLTRVAHLKPVRLIGGDEGAKNCDTILSGMLHSYRLDNMTSNPNHALICAALDKNINTVTSTSMGRLFDAVSAMLDVCHYNSYEGQAPIELENLAATTLDFYKLEINEDGDCKKLFEDIADALSKQVSSAEIARGFIYAISDYICQVVKRFSNTLDDKKQIVLSGGTFLNRILLERTLDQLEADGFNVYISEQLPPGDGGICLGQAFLSSKH